MPFQVRGLGGVNNRTDDHDSMEYANGNNIVARRADGDNICAPAHNLPGNAMSFPTIHIVSSNTCDYCKSEDVSCLVLGTKKYKEKSVCADCLVELFNDVLIGGKIPQLEYKEIENENENKNENKK